MGAGCPLAGRLPHGRHFHPAPAAGPGGHGQQRRGRPPGYPAPRTAAVPTDAPLDERALAQIRALQRPGQPSVLGKIIGLYLDGAPALLQRLREAVAAGDGEALRQAAHSFKSGSANLGATALAAACKELEQRGRERRLEGTAALLAEVDCRYDQVRAALMMESKQPFSSPSPLHGGERSEGAG
ncbi:MAG: Hpt domain-containing protein [Chromatiales bacterium]|nr:Hpt domain-containing protein [Chromatiales bacterium]